MSSSIKSLDIDELTEVIANYDQPKYRAKQIYEWLHTRNATSYDEMSNVPKALREKLAEDFPLSSNKLVKKLTSKDGSRKYLIELQDERCVEAVGIAEGYDESDDEDGKPARLTVCASSQAGCAMECSFCATGKQGLERNLSADEIVDQVVIVGKDFDVRVDNVVLMGQGEPFQNYDNVIEAIRRINGDKGLNIGARHITVSTSGVIDGIYRFAEEPEQFRLAVSLHAADQAVRNRIMPRLSGQPLRNLKKALQYYYDEKGRRITLEYMLLDGINDSEKDFNKLLEFCSGLNVHVNLIPFNTVDETDFRPSSSKTVLEWERKLSEKGIPASIRHSKGQDIAGACGQLKELKR